MLFVKSKSPLPTRSLRLLRAAGHSAGSALWLHHAHPAVAAAEKNLSHAEKQRVWSRSCGLQDLLRNIPISDGSMWPLQKNEYGDWAFNHSGWEVGLPAFQLPMFAECDYSGCQEEICFIHLFRLRNLNLHSLPVYSLMFLRAGFLRLTTTFASWRQLCSKRAAVSTTVTTHHFRPSHPVNRRLRFDR